MPLPTRDELLRERFDRAKSEANSLIQCIADAATPQYRALADLLPQLEELAAHFGEPLQFRVSSASYLPLKALVIQAIGPAIKTEEPAVVE